MIQAKSFDGYEKDYLDKMNEFMKDVEVVDVKMNTVVAPSGAFFTRYLVIYKQKESD